METFGGWTVIQSERHNFIKATINPEYFLCQCVCGIRRCVSTNALKSGASQGCAGDGCGRQMTFKAQLGIFNNGRNYNK